MFLALKLFCSFHQRVSYCWTFLLVWVILILLQEAYKNGFISGSTASVVLTADGQIFVAYVGDSKAFLFSKDSISPDHVEGSMFLNKFLVGLPYILR